MITAEQASLKVSEDANLEQPDVNISPNNLEKQEVETTVATSEAELPVNKPALEEPAKEPVLSELAPFKARQKNLKKTSRVPRQNLYLLFHKKQKSSLNSVNKSAEKEEEQKSEKKLSLWKVRKKIHQVGQFRGLSTTIGRIRRGNLSSLYESPVRGY